MIGGQPSYHNQFTFYEMYNDGQPNVLHADAHHSVAVYIPDVSITIAWGLVWSKDFKEDWCKQFHDPHAYGCTLDVFFNNALVYRVPYVWVDGISLPLPRRTDEGLQVTRRACDLMKVIDRMGLAPRQDFNPYESDVRLAGFAIVEEEWPEL
jgi:hypothetical protein